MSSNSRMTQLSKTIYLPKHAKKKLKQAWEYKVVAGNQPLPAEHYDAGHFKGREEQISKR